MTRDEFKRLLDDIYYHGYAAAEYSQPDRLHSVGGAPLPPKMYQAGSQACKGGEKKQRALAEYERLLGQVKQSDSAEPNGDAPRG